ncbi:MAG: hypothetical protein ACTSRZ_03940, partial [Promethearchaeota archaeon]
MRSSLISAYPKMAQAGISVGDIIDKNGALRLDKLREVINGEKNGKRDWALYNKWKPVLIHLKYRFATQVRLLYNKELELVNCNKVGRKYKYPPILIALAQIVKLVDKL